MTSEIIFIDLYLFTFVKKPVFFIKGLLKRGYYLNVSTHSINFNTMEKIYMPTIINVYLMFFFKMTYQFSDKTVTFLK